MAQTRVGTLQVKDGDIQTVDIADLAVITSKVADKAVTLAKMADVPTASVFYRKTAATGVPEVQTLATLKADLGLVGTNSGDVIAAALSKVDDINITLALGGSPLIALLAATTITVGWAGTLADARITSAATWNTAFNERRQWDGGTLNLVVGTARTSLLINNVDNTSDANKPVSTAQAAADTNTLNSAKTYADGLVVGLWDDRGNYSAATNVFPSAGGSGAGGAILKGDIWTISAVGTLGGVAVSLGDTVRALSDAPVQVVGSWSIAEGNLGYTPYNSSNPAGYTSNLGTVTSIGLSGGTTGMTFSASITGSGVITMAGVLAIANGGTNSTAAATLGGVGYGTGSAHAYTPVGIAGQVLQSAAGAAPIWKTLEMTDIPGAAYKATCRVASTANITTLSGLLTIDGIVLVANDRVLVKDQTASQNNGIYIASAGAWVRSVGANVSSEINTAIVTIDLGTVNTGSIFTNKFKSSDTLGTTVMPWFKVYSTDWFAPLTSVGAAGPVLSSGGLTPVISMPAATTSVAGHLTAADWNTFNNKQPAGSYLTGTKVDSFNTRTGPVTLSSADVTNALTYTPVQPNGTGAIGSWGINVTGSSASATIAGLLTNVDQRTISPSSGTANRLQFGFTSWNNNNTGPYADFLHLRSYQDGTGGSDNLVTFLKSGIGMRVWQQAYGSATAYATFKDVAFTDDSRFTDARTPLSHSLLSHTAITIAQLSTLVSDATLISSTDSRLSDARTPLAHNHITLTGVTSISFATDPSDSASISTTINANGTYFDFNLTDDNNNDWWRWRFTPSGSVVYDAMTLKPVANGISNLTVSGSVLGSNLSGTNTGDNPGVTSVTSSGSYGGLTLTGSTGPTAATVVLGGTPTGTWPISISGNSSNSTNIIGAVPVIYSTTQGTSYQQSVQILEKNAGGGQGGVMSAAPRLAFHWQSVVASSIAMESSGRIGIFNNPGTGYENFIAKDVISSGGIFSGPGTGLTGTALALNIGGSSRLINIGTTSSISDLNIVPNDNAVRFDTFVTTATNKPASGNNANGVITFTTNHGSQYGKQIAFVDNDDLYIRRLTGSTFAEWRQIIHSGNIGGQSVNYATTAGFATDPTKLPLAGGIMSGLIQSTSTEFFRGVSTSAYISFYNAANTARTGYIQFNAGAASRISVEIVQPLAFAVNGGDRLTLNTDGTSTFSSSVTATAFYGPSDMRLKTLVDKVHTSSVLNIEEISYLWKDNSMGGVIQVGYDASKVKEHMPNAVNIDDKGFMSVNYIQVLVAKVASLEKQLKQLQNGI